MKKSVSLFIVYLFFITPFVVSAQETDGARVRQNKQPVIEKQIVRERVRALENEGVKKQEESLRIRVQSRARALKERLLNREEPRTEDRNGFDRDKTRTETRVKRAMPEDVRAQQEKRQEKTVGERLAERQAQVVEKRKERVDAYFKKMFTRLDAAIERLQKLAERIESRIVKFEKRGADVDQARELLTVGHGAITEARTLLENARGIVENILAGDDPRVIFEHARETVKSVIDSIKQAHRALVDSIVALKGASAARGVETNEE